MRISTRSIGEKMIKIHRDNDNALIWGVEEAHIEMKMCSTFVEQCPISTSYDFGEIVAWNKECSGVFDVKSSASSDKFELMRLTFDVQRGYQKVKFFFPEENGDVS